MRLIWRISIIASLALTCVLLGMSIRISFDWMRLSGAGDQPAPDEVARLRADLATAQDPFEPVIKVARLVTPSVVSIDVRSRAENGRSIFAGTVSRGGSGVILDEEGHILTNWHVVEDPDRIVVTLADGRSYRGSEVRVVGYDLESDLAVLKIRGSDLVPIEIARSDEVEVGQAAIAIGSPFSLQGTVTLGMVSSKARRISTGERRALDVDNYIQTDAAINPGNSGGPLVDIHGRMIGINTMIVTQTSAGVGFAIPSKYAANIAGQIIENGTVSRGGLGVWFPNQLDPARFGYPSGVFVEGVIRGTAADRGGIEPRDVIVRYDGNKVEGYESLRRLVRKTPPGKTVPVVVFREDRYRELDIAVGTQQDLQRYQNRVRRGDDGSGR
jgi:S1-C subfamily serine protease